jgi:fucose permease
MSGSQALLALTICCAFSFGLLVVLFTSMRWHLASHLGVSHRRLDSLWAAMNFALVPLTFVAGYTIDQGDVRWVVVAGSVLVFLALLILRSVNTFRGAMTAYLLTAGGGGCISAASIVLMPLAFFGPGEATASLNMGNVFFAVGALIAPALADVLLRGTGLRRSLLLLAFGSLLPGIIAVLTPADVLPRAQDTDVVSMLTEPVVLLAAGVFFLYAPLEGCLHTWASSYLHNMGYDERRVHRLIAAFWSSFLVGRLLLAWMQHSRWLPEHAERWYVCILALGATVMLGNLAGAVHRRSASFGLVLLGLFLGPIFPTLVGFLFSIYPSGHGTLFGTLFALGSAGSLVIAPLMSARVNRTSPQAALRIPLTLGILLLATSLVFALWQIER